jgi:hypothetical protein
MKKITEYKVLTEESSWGLVKSVYASMAAGWQPQGGICVVEIGKIARGAVYLQAMVK